MAPPKKLISDNSSKRITWVEQGATVKDKNNRAENPVTFLALCLPLCQ